MEFEYLQDDLAIKILKKAKARKKFKNVLFLILIIFYCILLSKSKSMVIPTIIFIFSGIISSLIIERNHNKYLLEIIDLNYPEGLLNLSIYNYRFLQNRLVQIVNPSFIKERYTVIQLSNIASAYALMGDIENALKVITYLETQYNVKNKIANNLKEFIILNIKLIVSYKNNDMEEFEKQNIKINEVLENFPEKIRNDSKIKIDLRNSIMKNDIDEVNKLCDELDKSNKLSDKVYSAYFRALILEKNNKEGWKEYYQYVADNGNTLAIAKKAREKLAGGSKNGIQ